MGAPGAAKLSPVDVAAPPPTGAVAVATCLLISLALASLSLQDDSVEPL